MLGNEGRFALRNDTVYQALGYDRGEVFGQHYSVLISGQRSDQVKHVFDERRAGDRISNNVELMLLAG
jgi:hypothetical protein